MNWRTRCTKYSPTCPLVFTSGMTYRTVLTTGRDENTSCPVGTEYTISLTRLELSRDDDAVTLASINLELSKLTSSNERISGEVNALKMSPVFAQSANRSSRCVFGDIPRCSRIFRGINADGLCWYHQVWGSSARKCAEISVLSPRSEDRDRSPVNIICSCRRRMAQQFERLGNALWQLSLVWQSRLSGASPLQVYQNQSSVPISCATMDY